ncbi:MAG: phosphate/phosphite/phosphonate ABC transporter substrate-binding protein [Rhodospirillales bacterium]|nr:MAG: phosphate/phosphite/phosphonate ABC transporter substrate-binding protein [Rhodospirillales bacterium]
MIRGMTRRAALGLAAFAAAGAMPAMADEFIGGWQKKYPVVKYGVIPVETQGNTTKSMDAFLRHAEKETGAKWELYTATDYSGVMNALIAGQIHVAWLSGFSYCQTHMDSKGGVEALVAAQEPDGSMGYNAVIVVKSDSPYKTHEDLKGKIVARTDPLSGSGYLIPTAAFRQMGKPVDQYYQSPLAGGHPQAVLGVLRGTYDGAFTWTSKDDNIGNLRQMMNKGLLKREQVRIVWTSPQLPSPPVVIRTDLPLEMRADIQKLFIRLKDHSMSLAESVAQGKTNGMVRVYHEDYRLMCQAAELERDARKQRKN